APTIRAARMGRLKLRALACADAFIAPSRALADAAQGAGLPLGRIHRMPNGVDRTRFCPIPDGERRARRQEWMTPQGWSENDLLVVFLGAIESRKGVDVLLEAWPQVTAQCAQARLIIAGPETLWSAGELVRLWRGLLPLYPRELAPGPAGNRPGHLECLDEWVHVREQARSAKAEASLRTPKQDVEFVGAIPNPESLLAAADIFCLPSRAEGLPNAALEAMSCATACVLSRLEGVTTGLLPKHEAEALVPPGDADALAKALVRMLQDDALREAVGDEGMKASIEYEMEDIAARYAALYKDLLHSQSEE
ncbi:MAG: glycosyltransferase family 4 protein, partial [Candidatus Hydrogenedentes bacterium]|nr:glycosyltransferase family 4 protein [Candidatus Hydrogenedentota bacterium]